MTPETPLELRIIWLLDRAAAESRPCRGCGRRIWLFRSNGKTYPLTSELINHFADCPAAAQFRKKKPAAGPPAPQK